MTKILTFPNSLHQINELIDLSDGFIVGIKDLSVNNNLSFTLEEIEVVINKIKKNKKEVFILINKNIFNDDLKYLENTLLFLNNLNIDGVFYYDISVLSIVKKLNLNINLVWSQEHLTTNYLKCNFYYEKNVKYVYLSSEITLNEILDIKEKTKLLTIVPIFGYLPMFNSKRHIVKNYLEYFNLNDNSKINYIENDNKIYPIVDDEFGTTVYGSSILNGLNEYLILKDKNIDYVTINSFNIEDKKIKNVLEMFKNVNEDNKNELNENLEKMFNNLDKGFLYKETIYRVKKDGKK